MKSLGVKQETDTEAVINMQDSRLAAMATKKKKIQLEPKQVNVTGDHKNNKQFSRKLSFHNNLQTCSLALTTEADKPDAFETSQLSFSW